MIPEPFATYLTTNLPLIIKLVTAVGLGAIIGAERTLSHKMVGMRTYAFVSLGSCLLVIISLLATERFIGFTNFDPMRMAAGIVMGIGFLCGGIIIYHDNRVVGVTTAAGMWVANGIGIAVAFGYYTIAVMTTLLTLFIFSTLWGVEEKLRHDPIE
jgi:putative Mg2+ transporter-C (MgtC) family protein